ncbi:hypothetical protein Lepto7376_3357 [[Leptolyngbya] sp. PCC 7376]|uniref:hypothetical protein n=1 Tax=[Leptolyngbya] sp. PCC 7376 TaxID=111781 RepID=UPI00029F17C9|nr:hypothetical protein [[Leptolyngbya] sp. PCC 7376]AFY39571.1 hypothetical protein Lepto7376_3357 [[Leptolyngbya] sp. PCC 7376]
MRAAGPNATIEQAVITDNTVSSAGNYADGTGILTHNDTSFLNQVTIIGNNVLQSGANSFIVQARNASEAICIAQFSNNSSGLPHVT